MSLSDKYYNQFKVACDMGLDSESRSDLYMKWQNQLKKEDKFYILGKPMSILAW